MKCILTTNQEILDYWIRSEAEWTAHSETCPNVLRHWVNFKHWHYGSGSLHRSVLCCTLPFPYVFLINCYWIKPLDLNSYKSTVYKLRSIALSEVCLENVHGLHPHNTYWLGQSLAPLMWVTLQVSLLELNSLPTHRYTHSNTPTPSSPHGAWCIHPFTPNSLQISTHFLWVAFVSYPSKTNCCTSGCVYVFAAFPVVLDELWLCNYTAKYCRWSTVTAGFQWVCESFCTGRDGNLMGFSWRWAKESLCWGKGDFKFQWQHVVKLLGGPEGNKFLQVRFCLNLPL